MTPVKHSAGTQIVIYAGHCRFVTGNVSVDANVYRWTAVKHQKEQSGSLR
jgi:hypothetical protein